MSLNDLWCAVVDRALRDAAGHATGEARAVRDANQVDAQRWLESDCCLGRGQEYDGEIESLRPESASCFGWVCDLADLNPESVRQIAASGRRFWRGSFSDLARVNFRL